MEYDYKKYNHRSKSLKSANTYLTKFFDNLELDYDDDSVYGSTIKNLLEIQELCNKVSGRIDDIVAHNSKELNQVKYTYLSIINSVGSFKYMNYQAVIEVSKHIDTLVNKIITEQVFNYEAAEQLPKNILKLILEYSLKSTDSEYVKYLRSLDIQTLDISKILKNVDFTETILYALVLYHFLWEHKFKPMGKFSGEYYLTPDSMYELASELNTPETTLTLYTKFRDDAEFIEKVGIR